MAQTILLRALPLIPTHGFTRQALALASPSAPLSDTSVTALFGQGDDARRTLIRAWLDQGLQEMNTQEEKSLRGKQPLDSSPLADVLEKRLMWNVPVMAHLKEAFALMAVRSIPLVPIPDARPAIEHALAVADEACYICPPSPNAPTGWYTRRAGIAAIYTAAELHQLDSPDTAPDFLRRLLDAALKPGEALSELTSFADFAKNGWEGILRGRGFP